MYLRNCMLVLIGVTALSCASAPPEVERKKKSGISPELREILENAGNGNTNNTGGGGATSTTTPPPGPGSTQPAGNTTIKSFGDAKKTAKLIFSDLKNSKTFYCGCSYTFNAGSSGGTVDWDSCGYRVRKTESRASRTEWEHVVPASAFGHSFREWKEGHPDCNKRGKPYKGRKCLGRVSREFGFMEADLYNLRPAIGEVNGDRSSKTVGEIPGEERRYGDCDVEINSKLVEPQESVRGNVARTYLYMDWAYPGRNVVLPEMRGMLEDWSRNDPVDEEEMIWAKAVERFQGNPNPFVVGTEKVKPSDVNYHPTLQ